MPDTPFDTLAVSIATISKAPLLEIAGCFENNQENDGDWSWDAYSITEAIYPILERYGVIRRCEVCQYDHAWHAEGIPECPQWDSHQCSNGCGNTNDECTCDNCTVCGYYDCECPVCDACNLVTRECDCAEEDRLWPADATS